MRRPAALMFSRRAARRLQVVALLAACTTLPGCFKYTRVEPVEVGPQEEVRVRVTTDAAMRIGPHLGSITERLEGRLTPAGDSLALEVWIGKDYIGSPFENARQRVSLGPREIVEVRRRTLSRTRTGLVAAGILLATAIIVDRVVFQPNPNPSPGDGPHAPPDPDPFRVPIRIR